MREIQDFLGLPKLTPGRRRAALERMRAEAVARGLVDLVVEIDAAIARESVALELELTWARVTEERAIHEDGARAMDGLVDKTLTGLYESLLLKERSFPSLAAVARSLLDIFFPQGTGPITHLPYIDQNAKIDTILSGLSSPPHRAALVALRLEDWLVRLQELNDQYGSLLMRPERLTYAQVTAADKAAYVALVTVVARVLGLHPTNSPADMEGRHALLIPYLEQQEAFAQLRARRRSEPAEEPEPDTELVPVSLLQG